MATVAHGCDGCCDVGKWGGVSLVMSGSGLQCHDASLPPCMADGCDGCTVPPRWSHLGVGHVASSSSIVKSVFCLHKGVGMEHLRVCCISHVSDLK
jgi:hypothetical protein